MRLPTSTSPDCLLIVYRSYNAGFDEHLAAFCGAADSFGFQITEVSFERREGEELVHLFDVRLKVK